MLHISRALDNWSEFSSIAPQTLARNKRILKTVSRHALKLHISEALLLGGFQELNRNLGTSHTFIIRGQRDRHAILEVSSQRMSRTRDAEDQIVARQTDLHHHIAASHFFQEFEGIGLVHDVDAVSDTFCSRDHD